MFEKIKNKITKITYEKTKQEYLVKSVGNIGEFVVEDDKIICYVSQEKLDKNCSDSFICDLHLYRTNTTTENTVKMNEYYNLNKPIYYIFENITFPKGVKIISFGSKVVFKNCTFHSNVCVSCADDIKFEHNSYIDNSNVYYSGNQFFVVKNAKKISFINEDFYNSSIERINNYYLPCFGMTINADTLEIINTEITTQYDACIDINTKNIKMQNSFINANEIYLESDYIDISYSYINSDKGVIIENKNCDVIENIDSPIIIYNGIEMQSKDKMANVSRQIVELQKARTLLTNKLKEISKMCCVINDEELKSIRKSYDNKVISKVLKK